MPLSVLITPETNARDLNEGECHIWYLDVSQLSKKWLEQYQHLLSPDEIMRAQKFTRGQSEFIALRIFVRLCLSRYAKIAPELLRFSSGDKGKPALDNGLQPVHFNLSHSDNVAALAVSLAEVGVDVESLSRSGSQRSIAERFFHPLELQQLAPLDDAAHKIYFFRLWTLKEALFKAIGTGLSAGLDKAAFALSGKNIQAVFADELNLQAADWQFFQTFLDEDCCLSLARQSSTPINVRWFDATTLFHMREI